LAGEIGFMQMSSLVEMTLSCLSGEIVMQNSPATLEAALQIDHLTRRRAHEAAQSLRQGR
jgi:1-deoxy-D-xylulose 5-phosphate reductoisomerase